MQCPSSMAVPLSRVLTRPRSAIPQKQPQFSSPVTLKSNSVTVQHSWSDTECLSLRVRPSLSFSRRTVCKASPEESGKIVASEGDDDGVSLGTMKLPSDTDLVRFETLLFQWANSLCQGANIPLPVPLKVDKVPGGARLGFITFGDGETQVLVYIDCLVFPADDNSPVPIFRAIRNGPLKDQPPPGEPRIMRSLLGALQKSVEIARL